MAVHIVLLGIVALAFIASFIFSMISGNKIFLVGAFIILAMSGIIIQASGGIIVDQRPTSFANDVVAYEDVIYDLDDPSVLMVSYLTIFIGAALTAWSSLKFILPDSSGSAFDF